METVLRRFIAGDLSLISLLELSIDGPQGGPSGEKGRQLYAVMASTLCRAGVEIKRSITENNRQGAVLPSEACVTIVRVLATVGARQGPDGVACRAALLAIGLQNCRDMCLDAYFLVRSEQDSLVVLVCILLNIFGCALTDLLQSQRNITYVASSAIPSINVQVLFPGTWTSGEFLRSTAHQATVGITQPETTVRNHALPAAQQHPHQSRLVPIPRRSSLTVPVLGTTGDPTPNPNRRFRTLPKKPASTPYAVNPLFDASTRVEESTVLAAQYPVPVVEFCNYYGLGCAPRVPNVSMFYKHQQEVAEGVRKVPDGDLTEIIGVHLPLEQGTSTGSAPSPDRSPADAHLTAVTAPTALARSAPVQEGAEELAAATEVTRAADPANPLGAPLMLDGDAAIKSSSCSSPQPEATTNGMSEALPRLCAEDEDLSLRFVECSSDSVVRALNARAVASDLLKAYLENGKLLGWGENTYHALGPLMSRACRHPPPMASSPASSAHAEHAPAGEALPVPPQAPLFPAMASPSVNTNTAQPASASSAAMASPPSAVLHATDGRPSSKQGGRDSGGLPPQVMYPSASSSSFFRAAGVGAASVKSSFLCPNNPHRNYCFCPTLIGRSEPVVDVSCGTLSTHIITFTGLLHSCGMAHMGQLGIGDRTFDRNETGAERFQKTILSRDERVVLVFAGCSTVSAVTKDGHVYCWGANAYGQCLRLRDTPRVLMPIRFKSGKFKPTLLSFGHRMAGVVYDDGLAGLWGAVELIGKPVAREAAEVALVPGPKLCVRKIISLPGVFGAPVALLRMGPGHVAVVTRTGDLYTWGEGYDGRLGHGTDQDEATPRLVEAVQQHFVVDVSCGNLHTAAVVATGQVYVFGENRYGQLGVRGLQARRTPTHLPLPHPALAVQCGAMSTCVLLENGDVMVCGPVAVAGVGLGAGRVFVAPRYILQNYITLRLACGPTHSIACALNRTVALMRVGHSSIEELSRMESLGVRSGVRDVAVGVGFVIVLSENGTMVALGRGEKGQLGVGPAMRPSKPGEVTVVSSFEKVRVPASQSIEFVAVTCGPDFVFALDQSARVYGWGNNGHGILLLSSTLRGVGLCWYEPTHIAAYDGRAILQIACGNDFVAALTDDGEVLTHGEYACCGLSSPLETPTRAAHKESGGLRVLTPSVVPGLRHVVSVAAGKYHAVAMTAAGVVYAWGKGVLGRASGNTQGVAYAPVKVAFSQSVRQLGCGPFNSFAITDVGDLYVWGSNEHGQCGVHSGKRTSERPGAVVVTPTLAARNVRDAAFATKFSLALFEDGTIRASGVLRHGGRTYHLDSFSDTPQPVFSADINTVPKPHGGKGTSAENTRSDSGKDEAVCRTTASAGTPTRGRWGSVTAGGAAHDGRQLAEGETFFTPSRTVTLGGPGRAAPTENVIQLAMPTVFGLDDATSALRGSTDSLERGGERWHVMQERTRSPFLSTSLSREGPFHRTTGNGGSSTVLSNSVSLVPDGTSGVAEEQPRLSARPRDARPQANNNNPPPSALAPAPPLAKSAAFRRPSTSQVVRPPSKPENESAAKGGGGGSARASSASVASSATRRATPATAAAAVAAPVGGLTKPNTSGPPTFTGVRCFGGWDQIFAVVEKHRPASEEVRLAHRGMQVYLRAKQEYADNVL